MDKDYIAMEFSGKDLGEVVNKMVMFINAIKGINLVNVPEERHESKADSDRLLQSEPEGVREEVPGDRKGPNKNTK